MSYYAQMRLHTHPAQSPDSMYHNASVARMYTYTKLARAPFLVPNGRCQPVNGHALRERTAKIRTAPGLDSECSALHPTHRPAPEVCTMGVQVNSILDVRGTNKYLHLPLEKIEHTRS